MRLLIFFIYFVYYRQAWRQTLARRRRAVCWLLLLVKRTIDDTQQKTSGRERSVPSSFRSFGSFRSHTITLPNMELSLLSLDKGIDETCEHKQKNEKIKVSKLKGEKHFRPQPKEDCLDEWELWFVSWLNCGELARALWIKTIWDAHNGMENIFSQRKN